jgi:hypothetical protein
MPATILDCRHDDQALGTLEHVIADQDAVDRIARDGRVAGHDRGR